VSADYVAKGFLLGISIGSFQARPLDDRSKRQERSKPGGAGYRLRTALGSKARSDARAPMAKLAGPWRIELQG